MLISEISVERILCGTCKITAITHSASEIRLGCHGGKYAQPIHQVGRAKARPLCQTL